MLGAIFKHIVLLLSFRHSGAGLPTRGPLPVLFLTCAAIITFLRDYVDRGGFLASLAMAAIGASIIFLAGRRRPALVAPVALVCIGGDFLAIMVMLLHIPMLVSVISLWQVASITTFIARTAQAGR